jgi:hypothetical protein
VKEQLAGAVNPVSSAELNRVEVGHSR